MNQDSLGQTFEQAFGHIDFEVQFFDINELFFSSLIPHEDHGRLFYISLIGGNLVMTVVCLLAAWKLRQVQKALVKWTVQLNALEADLAYRLVQSTELILANRQTLQMRRRYNHQQQTRIQSYWSYLKWSRYLWLILRWSQFRSGQSGKVSL